jgi:hypothetical protein
MNPAIIYQSLKTTNWKIGPTIKKYKIQKTKVVKWMKRISEEIKKVIKKQ